MRIHQPHPPPHGQTHSPPHPPPHAQACHILLLNLVTELDPPHANLGSASCLLLINHASSSLIIPSSFLLIGSAKASRRMTTQPGADPKHGPRNPGPSSSGLPSKIVVLFANDCSSIESLSFSSSSQPFVLALGSCSKLVEIQGLVLDSNSTINLHGCDNLSSDFKASLLQCPSTKSTRCNRQVFLPGNEIPNWFIHQRFGSSISLHLPSVSEGKICMLLICGVYSRKGFDPLGPKFNVILHNKTRGYREALLPAGLISLPINDSEDMFLFRWQVVRNKMVLGSLSGPKVVEIIGNGDEIEVSFILQTGTEVRKCGVHLVVDEPKEVDIHGSADKHVNSNDAC
ncbi:hypothetical protein CJ030_MR6G003737 [Morella rubra]|uniref:C-JID domain-containing protein n=1 Tax=Morella rubra TaxID=262757 RepID=A0A6A1WUC1_9ROSI|nr:hypothetical protein CJ030_MR6G003737 [Morella rubra]